MDPKSAKARLRRHAHGEWEERIKSIRYFQEVVPRRAACPLGQPLELRRNVERNVETVRLHTGHSTLLAGYRHHIGQQNDPTCPECGAVSEKSFYGLSAQNKVLVKWKKNRK